MDEVKDIVPGLLDDIQKDFEKEYNSNKVIKSVLEKISNGTATYEDAHAYSIEVGEALSKSYLAHITEDMLPDGRMYYNIANRIVTPTMTNNYNLTSEVSLIIQDMLNQADKLGLKAVKAPINKSKIIGIVDRLSDGDTFDDVSFLLGSPIVTYTQSVVDDTVKANVEAHYKRGLSPVIKRIVHGHACKWCMNLAGTYAYPDDVPSDVYRRHDNCRCTVTYDPRDGSRRIQDVHSKKYEKR